MFIEAQSDYQIGLYQVAFNRLENWNFPVLGWYFLVELHSYIDQAARRKDQDVGRKDR